MRMLNNREIKKLQKTLDKHFNKYTNTPNSDTTYLGIDFCDDQYAFKVYFVGHDINSLSYSDYIDTVTACKMLRITKKKQGSRVV